MVSQPTHDKCVSGLYSMTKVRATLAILFFLALVSVVSAQQRKPPVGLPDGALMIETQSLAAQGHPDRALVLWMLKPKRNPRDNPSEPYTCPEETRGSYWSGPTRVSLVNLKTNRIINTVEVVEEFIVEENSSYKSESFDIPYRIHAGSYYHVPGIRTGREGKPVIMWLRDYNGDGKALEFALFDAQACMGLGTTLIGYSKRQDKVIQYTVQLAVKGDRESENGPRLSQWCDYLFSKSPARPGYWTYEIDYRGRAGSLDKYEIHYNAAKEMFEGTLVWTAKED